MRLPHVSVAAGEGEFDKRPVAPARVEAPAQNEGHVAQPVRAFRSENVPFFYSTQIGLLVLLEIPRLKRSVRFVDQGALNDGEGRDDAGTGIRHRLRLQPCVGDGGIAGLTARAKPAASKVTMLSLGRKVPEIGTARFSAERRSLATVSN